jgi:predicted CoA-binding protein
MITMKQAADEFLACHRIAVTGVSRTPTGHGANTVYTRLLERGYEAIPVNPNASEIDGRPCYPSLGAIPDGVDAVVIATAPVHAMGTMIQAVKLGVRLVWMHRAMDAGSVSVDAGNYGREHGVRIIEGGCPLMFDPVADRGHKVICLLSKLSGRTPKEVM